MKKTSKGTPYNRRGFHTLNNTQNMSKRDNLLKGTGGTERAITETTEDAPSGEQSLPDIH